MRINAPMHSTSVISMIEKFVPSLHVMVIFKCVIIDSCFICIFVGNVPSVPDLFNGHRPGQVHNPITLHRFK